MASWRRHNEGYPHLPRSLNADPYYPDHSSSTTSSNTMAATPYIGWKARISQLPINRWTVLILLVLIRVLIMLSSMNEDIGSAEEKALNACTKVEDVGSAMASMPHYLSLGVNDLAAGSMTRVVHGLVTTLELILTGVQEIILFVINMVVGTYVCLISALIHGGLDAAKGAVEGVTNLVNDAIDGIANGIDDEVKSFQDLMNSFSSKINDLVGTLKIFPNVEIPLIPSIDLSDDIQDLKNFDIDTSSITEGLANLNDTIPDFQDVKDMTRKAISIPFDLVKEQIDSAWGNYSFNRDVFPLAEKQALTFCSDNSKIRDFFESLFELAATAKIGFIVGLVIAAVLAMAAMYPLEKQRWNRQKRLSKLVHDKHYNPLDVIYITSRPVSSRIGIWLGDKLASGRRSVLVRWAWAYGTTLPALFLLSLALAGFFSSLCQYFVLIGVEKKVPELAEHVGDFAGDVVNSLQAVSTQWAADANGVILDFNNDLNEDVFGYVTEATDAVNDTLNTFVDKMNSGLEAVFQDTPLEQTIDSVVYCLVTAKIEGIQKGITWVHDHAHVEFPLFNNDTFSLGAQQSIQEDSDIQSFLANPRAVTTDELTETAQRVADHIRNNLVTELLISTGILLTYIIVVLIGVLVAAVRMASASEDGDADFITHIRRLNNGDSNVYKNSNNNKTDDMTSMPRSYRRLRSVNSVPSLSRRKSSSSIHSDPFADEKARRDGRQ